MKEGEVILKPGREKSLLRFHPWVMSGAIAQTSGELSVGATVVVRDASGAFLGRGAWSPQSQISVRMWSFAEEAIDVQFFHRRLECCVARRRAMLPAGVANYRLVHGEADGLPGCVIDRYGDYFVCQFLSAGAERWRREILDALRALFPEAKGCYERSDTDARQREGLEERCGLLYGEEPPLLLEIEENGARFLVDVRKGHKTGFYLDQRENRAVHSWPAGGEVLNCFCYTGGFGVCAALAGARHVTQVDLSADALALARQNAERNLLPEGTFEYLQADVFQQLRKFRDEGRSFDVVILDPPKFAERHSQLERACRGYKDINLLGAKLTRPGGVLMTYSCSGAMTPELFRKVVGDACRDARREAYLLKELSQAPDHPITLNFPEGHYLTGLVLLLP